MGSTGNPGGEPSLAPRGPVTPSRKHGAGRKGAPATHDICPARPDLYHAKYQSLFRLAVLLTCKRRRRGGGGAGLLCRVAPPAEAPADGGRRLAAPAATAGGPVTAGQASPALGRQQAAPGGGRGRLLQRHPAPDTAARRLGPDPALRRLPTGQREAIVLTLHRDLNPEQAAAAMRMSLATLRRRLDEAGQRCGPSCLQP
jgi:hypothetical protein